MQSFQTAKNLLLILIYIGWASVALCAIGAISAINQTDLPAIYIIVGAASLSVVGFLIVGIAQMGLTQISTAENTGQMLDIMRRQGEIASLETPVRKTSTTPKTGKTVGPKNVGSAIKTYKGYLITKAEEGVEVEGETFPNLFAAEKWINQNPK